MKRSIVSAVMLALGIAVAATASALPSGRGLGGAVRQGGVFRVSMGVEGFAGVDPVLAASPKSSQLLQATCAKLMNYPDKKLPAGSRVIPEVASRYRVSGGGKVYTFNLRGGFRFNTGERLSGRSFQRAIERALDPRMGSPGRQYTSNIVGARKVLAGKASTPSGVVAGRRKLVIRLTRAIPDFPAWLATPPFCAVPSGLPVSREGVGAYASAGPYYIADYRPGQRIVLRNNPHYGGKRPHHVGSIVVKLTPSPDVIVEFERGAADWAAIPKVSFSALVGREFVRKYVASGRLRFAPSRALSFLVLNSERRLFRNNATLRRAVNLAADRARLANAFGLYAARPTDQYLPIGFPGFRDVHIYAFRPRLRRANTLASGHRRGGKAVMYAPANQVGASLAQIVKGTLARIGLDVEIKTFPAPQPYFDKLTTRGEPFDIAVHFWQADYNDPSIFINLLLHGRGRGEADDSHFNSPKYNRLMDRASRLRGAARYRAYAKLEHRLVRDAAPLVAFADLNEPTLVSARVDPRCEILNPELDLAAVCLKR